MFNDYTVHINLTAYCDFDEDNNNEVHVEVSDTNGVTFDETFTGGRVEELVADAFDEFSTKIIDAVAKKDADKLDPADEIARLKDEVRSLKIDNQVLERRLSSIREAKNKVESGRHVYGNRSRNYIVRPDILDILFC